MNRLVSFLGSRPYKRFMSMLYGLGASVVIIGALFKIVHITGANEMLFVGLITESIIFFFSAFEPMHIEPDWSLVYPELAGFYHDGYGKPEELLPEHQRGNKTVTQELDNMLLKAKIGPELIESLGTGLRKMSEHTSKMADITSATAANEEFVKNLKDAGQSASILSSSYKKTAEVLNQDHNNHGDFSTNLKSAAISAGTLAESYKEAAETVKMGKKASEEYASSIASASKSANDLTERYIKSADLLTKSADLLDFNAADSKNYKEQMQKISSNLGALNAVYELQLQATHEQLESTNKLRATVGSFLTNMHESAEHMNLYKDDVDQLTKRVSALNQVYGNMLAAMNVK